MLDKHWENIGALHNLDMLCVGIEEILIKYWCETNIDKPLREDFFPYEPKLIYSKFMRDDEIQATEG